MDDVSGPLFERYITPRLNVVLDVRTLQTAHGRQKHSTGVFPGGLYRACCTDRTQLHFVGNRSTMKYRADAVDFLHMTVDRSVQRVISKQRRSPRPSFVAADDKTPGGMKSDLRRISGGRESNLQVRIRHDFVSLSPVWGARLAKRKWCRLMIRSRQGPSHENRFSVFSVPSAASIRVSII